LITLIRGSFKDTFSCANDMYLRTINQKGHERKQLWRILKYSSTVFLGGMKKTTEHHSRGSTDIWLVYFCDSYEICCFIMESQNINVL